MNEGGYKNLPCPKCRRNTKHKKVQVKPRFDEVLDAMLGERWRCLKYKEVEDF